MSELNRPIVLTLALCGALLASAAPAQRPLTPEEEDLKRRSSLGTVPARAGTGSLGTGSVQYDPGAPADTIPAAPGLSIMIGNLFNSRLGGPLSTGTVTQLSWYQGAIGTVVATMPWKVITPGVGFNSAFNASVTASYAFQVAPISVPIGPSFFAGLIGGQSSFGNIGVRSASTNSQGFHGIQRGFSPASSVTLPGQNAMVRVTGSIIIPVELLEFEVD